MVYLIHGDKDSLLEAPLAEGVSLNIAVTNPFPCSAVTLARFVLSAVAFVLFVGKLCMLGAVAAMRKFRTVRVSTRVCGFGGHYLISNRKKPLQIVPQRLFTIFSIIQYITLGAVQSMANRVTFRGRQSF